ncbi:translational activator of cytochrome c oxidase 1 [Anoplophora glabripennis]|nr:translational activator of cytochrome c oxidase 1 [Anoplophora glabripennis]
MLKNIIKSAPKLCENYFNNNVVHKRLAGHSKWQNIRHIKGAKDAERSQLFTKLSRQMKVAVQEGGSVDPKMNLKLSQVVDQAKRANMPVATIHSVLKSCQQDKSQAKSHMLEIKGPGSCFILCEVFTGQLHQLKMGMATILRKHQCKFGDGGGTHLFEEKGIIETEIPDQSVNKEGILDTATGHAIESGAEDVKLIDDVLEFSCGKTSLSQVVRALEQLNYKIVSASVEYIPLKAQTLQESDLALYRSLYEKLENLPEVVRLSDNIA